MELFGLKHKDRHAVDDTMDAMNVTPPRHGASVATSNNGKTMGKWENHWTTMRKQWENKGKMGKQWDNNGKTSGKQRENG